MKYQLTFSLIGMTLNVTKQNRKKEIVGLRKVLIAYGTLHLLSFFSTYKTKVVCFQRN